MRAICKIIGILYAILFCALPVCGQSVSQNYVRSAVMTAPFKSNPPTDFDLTRVTVEYYDGLGRPVQQVRQAAGGDAFDLHTITEYDSYGRPHRTWLPVESTGTSGAYLDPSRRITSITYNHLNQPLKFTFADGSYIEHKYRSDGTLYERIERERVISTVNGTGSTTATYKTSGFTQVGDFILEGTIPTRMYIEGGYVTLNPYNSTNTATSYNYYVHDNQGSVRAVLNEQGELTQATDYSAYGVPSTRYAGTVANNHLHLGLEWQPMKGVSGYYNNARFRDAILAGTFYQQDPLAEKYYPFSPYHYGANNPLRYVDVDGQKVISSKDNSVIFNMKYGQVRNYLKENGLYEQIKAVEDSNDYIVTIKDASGDKKGSRYNHIEHVLYIDLNHIVEHENGTNSPAFILRHEFDHAHSHMVDPEAHQKRIGTSNKDYKNEEEKRVMTIGDKKAGEKLKEPIRTNHKYIRLINTLDPTTHELESENNNKNE